MTSRRDVLKRLAGLGIATSCTGRPTGRRIEGSIVGGAHQRGHRIREGFRPRPARFTEVPVVIIGAGIAGLSAAWALQRAGFGDFQVLELEDAPGGTARSGSGPVTAYPWGAHYVPAPSPTNRPLVALLDEVGAVAGRTATGAPIWAEEVLCRDPQERIFFRSQWYEGLYPRVAASRDELAQLEAFEADMGHWAAWRDARGRRAFDLPRARGSDAEEVRALDRLSMQDYLTQHGWNAPRLRWFVEYGCRDDFGTELGTTSAWAGIQYFAARREGPDTDSAEFLTWPEGNGRLVSHLAQIAGARLRTGALVTAVDPGPDTVDVIYFDTTTQQTVGLRARHAVFALPRFLARHLVTPWRERPPEHLAETEYGCWMVANVTLRDRPASRGFPLAWDNVLFDSPSLGYVVATHQRGSDYGATVLTYYRPFTGAALATTRTEVLATTWDEWVELILRDLGPAHPGLAALVERVDVQLWGHAMVRPRPGFVWSPALHASANPLGRLRFAHTDLSGLALFEEAQYWGVLAAEDILRAQKRAFRSWIT